MTLGALEMTAAQRDGFLVELTKAHGRNIDGTIRATMNLVYEEFVQGLWIGEGTWPASYVTIVGNAQAQVSAQAGAYYAEYTSLAAAEPIGIAPVGALDWMVKPNSFSAQAMPLRFGRLFNEGASRELALNQAGRYGAELGAGDLQNAQRQVGKNFQSSSKVKLSGFRKIPSGAPCGWCLVVADQLYSTENVPSHSGCRCGVAPAVDGDGWAPGQIDSETAAAMIEAEPSSSGARSIAPPTPEAVARQAEIDLLPVPFG